MYKFVTPFLTAAVVLLSSIAPSTAAPLSQSAVAPYLHPHRMVDVGGHKLNLYCTGHGSPAVILEAGEGETSFTWRKVQPVLSRYTRVCSFDRSGMGFSEGGPLPRDANAMVADLHALLQNAGVTPPYVLVGHSIAGLYAPLFADRYPRSVAGMVLVDPSFPNQSQVLFAASPTMRRFAATAPQAYHLCYEAAIHHELAKGADEYASCGFPAHVAALVKAQCAKEGAAACELLHAQMRQMQRPEFWLDLGSEDYFSNQRDSLEDLQNQRNLGAMPLIVLTAANDTGPSPLPPAEMKAVQRVWTAGHDRLAQLSRVGVNFVVHNSGHYIQLDRPSVVISAIMEVISEGKR